MPINKRGGKGHKRGKKMTGTLQSTALTYKDTSQNQEYGKVIATLGDCRLNIQLVGIDPSSPNAKTQSLICKIPGAFRKKVYINKGDYILVSVREYQIDHVDVITKYSHSEALTLMKQGEIPMDDGTPAGSDPNDETPGFDIVVGDTDADKDAKNDDGAGKVTKDDNWFNSILPPTDSDSEDDGKTSRNNALNQKGVDLSNQKSGPTDKNKKKVTINLGLNKDDADGEEGEEKEEIDLETL